MYIYIYIYTFRAKGPGPPPVREALLAVEGGGALRGVGSYWMLYIVV